MRWLGIHIHATHTHTHTHTTRTCTRTHTHTHTHRERETERRLTSCFPCSQTLQTLVQDVSNVLWTPKCTGEEFGGDTTQICSTKLEWSEVEASEGELTLTELSPVLNLFRRPLIRVCRGEMGKPLVNHSIMSPKNL